MKNKEIFTIQIDNVADEEMGDLTPMYLCVSFYDLDEAINAAIDYLKANKDSEEVLEAVVYAGEYEDENGNVFGEPMDVWIGTNKDAETFREARKEASYLSTTANYYAIYTENV